jgi:hypothetical protein
MATPVKPPVVSPPPVQAVQAVQAKTPAAEPAGVKELSALSKEERQRRFEELRKRMGQSKFKVVGEQGVHYLWAAKNDSNEMTRLDILGYSIVREPSPKEVLDGTKAPKISASGLRADGTYTIGDVILTQVDQDVYDYLMLSNDEVSEQAVQNAKDSFRASAEADGVPTFEFSPKK